MSEIESPIIHCVNPDLGILRIEDGYFVVTTAVEWFLGSRYLCRWMAAFHYSEVPKAGHYLASGLLVVV